MQIELFELSIVIVAESNNPTILNPDFLRHNGIVDRRWQVDEAAPPLTTSVMSHVAFKEGLVVGANPASVSFTISAADAESVSDGESPPLEASICVDAAKGYLKTVPHVPYRALGVNPRASVRNYADSRVSNALRSNGQGMVFQSIVPQFEIKATYVYADRRTTFEMVDEPTRTLYRANIHRDIAESNQQMRVSTMLATLDGWESDLADFRALIANSIPRAGVS